MITRFAILILACMALSSCQETFRACTTEYVPGIRLNIYDAETGEAVVRGAKVVIRDGDYIEVISGNDASHPEWYNVFTGAYERPGVYRITVRKPGYQDWALSDVVVLKDECHVITQTIDVALKRR